MVTGMTLNRKRGGEPSEVGPRVKVSVRWSGILGVLGSAFTLLSPIIIGVPVGILSDSYDAVFYFSTILAMITMFVMWLAAASVVWGLVRLAEVRQPSSGLVGNLKYLFGAAFAVVVVLTLASFLVVLLTDRVLTDSRWGIQNLLLAIGLGVLALGQAAVARIRPHAIWFLTEGVLGALIVLFLGIAILTGYVSWWMVILLAFILFGLTVNVANYRLWAD